MKKTLTLLSAIIICLGLNSAILGEKIGSEIIMEKAGFSFQHPSKWKVEKGKTGYMVSSSETKSALIVEMIPGIKENQVSRQLMDSALKEMKFKDRKVTKDLSKGTFFNAKTKKDDATIFYMKGTGLVNDVLCYWEITIAFPSTPVLSIIIVDASKKENRDYFNTYKNYFKAL